MSAPSTSLPSCTGEPLSWLILERHALGELPAAEAGRVQAHLAMCAACAGCAAEALQPWSLPARAAPIIEPVMVPVRLPWWRRYVAGWATTAALACAAAGLLLVSRAPERSGGSLVASGGTLPGVKGGEVALELVRERQGEITHGADTFAPEDRWKVLVTCPSGRVMFWDVTVRDGDDQAARYPLAPGGPISCGNHVALPGAFRLSGTAQATVCASLAVDPVPRGQSGKAVLANDGQLCVVVRPEQ